MSVLISALIAAPVLAVVLLFARWRRRVLRAALSFGDERVKTLTIPEIKSLRGALADYLATRDGTAISDDPRVKARLALFDELLDRDRRQRALSYAGLKPTEQEPSQ